MLSRGQNQAVRTLKIRIPDGIVVHSHAMMLITVTVKRLPSCPSGKGCSWRLLSSALGWDFSIKLAEWASSTFWLSCLAKFVLRKIKVEHRISPGKLLGWWEQRRSWAPRRRISSVSELTSISAELRHVRCLCFGQFVERGNAVSICEDDKYFKPLFGHPYTHLFLRTAARCHFGGQTGTSLCVYHDCSISEELSSGMPTLESCLDEYFVVENSASACVF